MVVQPTQILRLPIKSMALYLLITRYKSKGVCKALISTQLFCESSREKTMQCVVATYISCC